MSVAHKVATEMESPSKIERRQAWASSRRKFTARDAEHRSPTAEHQPHFSLQDDVFVDGCSAGKIETWLQGCGNEATPAKSSHLTIGPLKTGTSFEDDLSLGAEATALYAASGAPQFSIPQQKLNLPLFSMGQSVASSAFSTTTNRTASSVSEVLQMRAEDAEETLFQLGFGCEEPQVTARIPVRFFNFPSQLRGINFRLFLESQLSRIRQEDPCLSLASRFRQVEALTAMANAFYSLYSHVSRTPLQKLAPPQLTFSSPIVERTMSRTSVRSEPRSPVERLKDTISKMCLYTGSRGSDSTSPSSSPRKRKCSLSDVVEKSAENDNEELCLQMEVDDLEQDLVWFIESKKELEEETYGENTERTDSLDHVPCQSLSEMTNKNIHNFGHALAECTPCLEPKPDMDVKSKDGTLRSVLSNSSSVMEPVPIIAHDIICPQVVEYVNQAPYRCLHTNSMDIKNKPFAHQMTNKPSVRQSKAMNLPKSELCQITITGWEDDTTLSNRDTQEQSSSNIKRFLSPVKPLNLSKQGNSFELEEVHSAEEEEATSSEFCSTVTLSVSTHQHKSSPLRGDSFQSDSSGYAEEDVHHSLLTPEKT
ncbi:protein TESPA1-like isoform X2 [Sinocyclocheilus anshuiensis]|uniref:protein TESPA1-like isoform X2 n=1 Tax=Sinocyclocheilus anshuiensis TaxID=1608454 RepID=UPI0007B7D60D|nr:PREDICTED: protein TESPA1-like isoform X2 [Sinocyclocheilus anshuiensis]